MDVVALMGLARNAEEEAPALAADLGLTTYETAMMLRAPLPAIVLRSDDRARTLDVLGKIRSRGVTVRRGPPCLGVAIRSNRAREADTTEPGVVDGDREEVATKRADGEKLRAT